MNKVTHIEKSDLGLITPFQNKYQSPKPKKQKYFSFPKYENRKKVEKFSEKKRKSKRKRMEYKQYNFDELQNMFDKKQCPKELNKIMDAIVDKQEVLFENNEETNNHKLEEEIYQ